MITKTGVFICPSCRGVVRSDGPVEDGVTCGECQHEFGKPGDPSDTKAIKVPGGMPKPKESRIVRNLTGKKSAPSRSGLVIERKPVPSKTLDSAIEEADVKDRDSDEEEGETEQAINLQLENLWQEAGGE